MEPRIAGRGPGLTDGRSALTDEDLLNLFRRLDALEKRLPARDSWYIAKPPLKITYHTSTSVGQDI